MKTAMVEKKSNLIKMENGKKDLPVGMSQSKYGSYRLQRTVNGKKYRFGSIQNLELALSVNAGIDELVEDLRKAQEEVVAVSADELNKMIVENSASDMTEITRMINALDKISEYRIGLLNKEIARLHKRLDNKKSFWQRITGR